MVKSTLFKSKYIIFITLYITVCFFINHKPSIEYSTNDIEILVKDSIKQILEKNCFNCHSHNTNSYWYSYLFPANVLIYNDIKNARENLNFSKWENYNDIQKRYISDNIAIQLKKKSMPPLTYKLMHKDLSINAREKLINYFESMGNEVNKNKVNY